MRRLATSSSGGSAAALILSLLTGELALVGSRERGVPSIFD